MGSIIKDAPVVAAGVPLGGAGVASGAELTTILGSKMEPPKGRYPSADIVTNELQAAAPAAYASQATWSPNGAPDRYRVGGILSESEGFWWNAINGNDISSSSLSAASITSYEIEFWCAGTDLTLDLRNDASVTAAYGAVDYKIFVDDMELPPSTGAVVTVQNGWNHTPNSSAVRYHVLKFTENRVRRIRLMLGLMALAQVRIPGTGDIWAAPPRLKFASLGDSWGHASLAGTEGTIVAGTFVGELAICTGWEGWNLHQGGTGPDNPGAGGGTSPFWSADRQAALAALPELDLIIVSGGGNDVSEDDEEMADLFDAMWSGIKAARPETPLVAVGLQAPNLFANLDTFNSVVRAHALANDDVDLFVDMWQPGPWITGTSGMLEDKDGNGSRDLFITNESVADIHPSHAGARNIAERLARALRGGPGAAV